MSKCCIYCRVANESTPARCTTNSYHSEPPQKNSAYKKEW